MLDEQDCKVKSIRMALKDSVGIAGITLAMTVPAAGSVFYDTAPKNDVSSVISKTQENLSLKVANSDEASSVSSKLAQWNNWNNWKNY